MLKLFLTFFILLMTICKADEPVPTQKQLKTLYNSLEPTSIPQLLAFYELYPQTNIGKKALARGWALLGGDSTHNFRSLPNSSLLQCVLQLVNKQKGTITPALTEDEQEVIQRLAKNLPNRRLKGFHVQNIDEIIALPSHEIDLAKALLISEFGEDKTKIASYESLLDLMALQLKASFPSNPSPEFKIRRINQLIFSDLGFRFPPHSQSTKQIDQYSFIPSVLDSRRGVCLGVSLLYLCLAQRLNLPLEIVTPPGHIFVRYNDGFKKINIETTARGIDLPDELYLGIETRSLQQRDLTETVGLIFFNQASLHWQQEDYNAAIQSYKKAMAFLPDDPLLQEFLGYQYLFVGKEEEGRQLLEKIIDIIPDHSVSKQSLAADYLNGKVDISGMKALFLMADETREGQLKKHKELKQVLEKWPEFQAGHFQLASTCLQLNKEKDALASLEKYHELNSNNPLVEFYLSVLHMQRRDFNKAWTHYHQVHTLVTERHHYPKLLQSLKKALTVASPE